MYIENPKTKGSGILCCIPQKIKCPIGCEGCFFQGGRSYLEPLSENLPNMPENADEYVVRINDGNDSNVERDIVMEACKKYKDKFYNTSIAVIDKFDAPAVLTLNPAKMTDVGFHKLEPIPKNLMFVRFRTNMWNINILDEVVEYYTSKTVPVMLTFMAYCEEHLIPIEHRSSYILRKRTMNSYYAITTDAWRKTMKRYENNIYVDSCGKIEGELGKSSCRLCGNCLREYYATKLRMKEI